MKNLKKLIVCFLIVICALSMTSCSGCSKQEETTAGGWTVATDGTITNEHRELFNKALGTIDGLSYEPIKLLETQVVAGMNYRFLCNEHTSAENDSATRVIVTIYEDLDGNAKITSVAPTE
ncbi:MAG: hypothetical protein IJU02_03925 [Lachnospiraceae bacterium]|nr:hypothetical protein [Lachnospiraceae bacterium]